MLRRRTLLLLLTLASPAFARIGWGRETQWRYKLTLTLDTPNGRRTGSSVGEIQHHETKGILEGRWASLEGEAVYVDMGFGKRPLVALLNDDRNPIWLDRSRHRPETRRWHDGPRTEFVLKLYDNSAPIGDDIENAILLQHYRGPQGISPKDLPDLISFKDRSEPTTWFPVDPNNIALALGTGVKWHSITVEVTDEPVTFDIENRLPWVKSSSGLGWRNDQTDKTLRRPDFERRHVGNKAFELTDAD
jgi:hypothetical protein